MEKQSPSDGRSFARHFIRSPVTWGALVSCAVLGGLWGHRGYMFAKTGAIPVTLSASSFVCLITGLMACSLPRAKPATGSERTLREWYGFVTFGIIASSIFIGSTAVLSSLRRFTIAGPVVQSLPAFALLVILPALAYVSGFAVLLRSTRLKSVWVLVLYLAFTGIPEVLVRSGMAKGWLSFACTPIYGSSEFYRWWMIGDMPEVSLKLVLSRILVLAAGRFFVLLPMSVRVRADGERGSPLFQIEQLVICAAVVLIGMATCVKSGLIIPHDKIRCRFPKSLATQHFTVYYTPPEWGSNVNLAEEHEWALYYLCHKLGRPVPQRRFESYVYKDSETLEAWTGWPDSHAVTALAAVHHIGSWGLPALRHELAHVLLGTKPRRLPSLIVEGGAEALSGSSWPISDRDLANIDRGGIVLSPYQLENNSVFWITQSTRQLAYPVGGSFSRFLIRNGGIDRFLKLYAGGSWELIYGTSLPNLSNLWREYLQSLPISWRDVRRYGHYYETHTQGNPIQERWYTPFLRNRFSISERMREGDWERAIALCESVPHSDPDKGVATIFQAACLRRLRRFHETRSLLDQVRGSEWAHPLWYFGMGRLMHEMGNQQRALLTFEEGAGFSERLKTDQDPYAFVVGLYRRPRLRMLLNQLPDDPSTFYFKQVGTRAAQIDPSFALGLLWRALDYSTDSDTALADAQRALQIGLPRVSDKIAAQMKIADCLAARGQVDPAAEHYDEVIRLSMNHPDPEQRWRKAEEAAEKKERTRWRQREGKR